MAGRARSTEKIFDELSPEYNSYVSLKYSAPDKDSKVLLRFEICDPGADALHSKEDSFTGA